MANLNERPATIDGSIGDDRTALVTVTGDLDLASVPEIEIGLEAFLHVEQVVFDLSAVTFMDSSGIAMLLRTTERVGSVAVRNPSLCVRLVIEATGLTEVLPIER
jgi:anti-anti-sigma factor